MKSVIGLCTILLILSLYTLFCTQTQVPQVRPRPDPSVTIRAREVCAIIKVENVIAVCGDALAVAVRVQIDRFRDGCERDYEVMARSHRALAIRVVSTER